MRTPWGSSRVRVGIPQSRPHRGPRQRSAADATRNAIGGQGKFIRSKGRRRTPMSVVYGRDPGGQPRSGHGRQAGYRGSAVADDRSAGADSLSKPSCRFLRVVIILLSSSVSPEGGDGPIMARSCGTDLPPSWSPASLGRQKYFGHSANVMAELVTSLTCPWQRSHTQRPKLMFVRGFRDTAKGY
jgi:hypothetical protein